MAEYYIGLMSGTSMDALDAALVDFSTSPPRLESTHSHPFSQELRTALLALAQPGDNEIERLAQLDIQLGQASAELCLQLLQKAGVSADQVQAIGSHGQTIRHAPYATPPYTLQITDPNTIAELTGITTVADFRRRDLVVGGQGAPLVPAFHQALFRNGQQQRAILNIGGIANLSVLPADPNVAVTGFDTGPGNMLMDAWAQLQRQQPYDHDGAWARSGTVDQQLLTSLLSDVYFEQQPPKSTGREQYNLSWLQRQLRGSEAVEDVQATLCELTAVSIARAISQFAPLTEELFICGGGARNSYLLERIRHHLSDCRIDSSEVLGIAPQWMEAIAFAWLARQTLLGLTGNLPAVTGADEEVILGGIYPGRLHHH